MSAVLDDVCAARGIEPDDAVAYLCGNPDMVEACRSLLAARGFRPEDIHVETYQPSVRKLA